MAWIDNKESFDNILKRMDSKSQKYLKDIPSNNNIPKIQCGKVVY